MSRSASTTYVIVGAGLAGHSAAEALRRAGFDGRIVLIGDESYLPYERPPLSKGFLQGTRPAEELALRPATYYDDLAVDLLLGVPVTGIDLEARRLTRGDGTRLGFDRLLIATGARPIRLRQPGFDLPGVHYLRTIDDAERLKQDLSRAVHVLVVGAGFIGSEVAASARVLGRSVTLVDLLPAPLAGVLGEEIGRVYAAIHERQGVALRMGTRVTELRGAGQVEEAILDTGERIACDLVVVGVGVRPETSLVEGTGIAIENGILVDELCRTSVPDVFAAGDVANWWHPRLQRRLRVEHFDNAGQQGAAAGMSMAGTGEPYAPIPYFWSDQYEVNLQWAGFPGSWERLVLRGDPAEPSLTGFYLAGGRVQAAVTINQPREFRATRRIVEAGVAIDPAVLADPNTDLRALSRRLPRDGASPTDED